MKWHTRGSATADAWAWMREQIKQGPIMRCRVETYAPGRMVVLLTLAHVLDEEGADHMRILDVASYSGLSDSSVTNHLRWMAEEGATHPAYENGWGKGLVSYGIGPAGQCEGVSTGVNHIEASR